MVLRSLGGLCYLGSFTLFGISGYNTYVTFVDMNAVNYSIDMKFRELGPNMAENEFKGIVKIIDDCYEKQVEANKIYKYMNLGIGGLALIGFNLSSRGGNPRSGKLRVGGFIVYMIPFIASVAA